MGWSMYPAIIVAVAFAAASIPSALAMKIDVGFTSGEYRSASSSCSVATRAQTRKYTAHMLIPMQTTRWGTFRSSAGMAEAEA